MHKAADRIRNVALVGHRGSGKTSLHEALLFEAGVVNRLGSVVEGTTVSDTDPDEKARQMSISLALSTFEWQDRKVNLIDTPGEPSFVADMVESGLHPDALRTRLNQRWGEKQGAEMLTALLRNAAAQPAIREWDRGLRLVPRMA